MDEGAVERLNPEVTILMIGTNNTGHRQEAAGCTAKGVGKILDELTERLPETEILLLSIFPRGETRDDALRQINSDIRSEEHTSELQSRGHLVCRLLLEKKKT